MPIDPSAFKLNNVIDTCAIWNLLSSRTLYSLSSTIKCTFCMTDVVYYECFIKERSRTDSLANLLRSTLEAEMQQNRFKRYQIAIEDLQDIEQFTDHKKYGKGELSTIALANKFKIALMTDDKAARKLAAIVVREENVQTVPHLLGWLIFEGTANDSDKETIIAEHEKNGGKLKPYFETIYLRALDYRLRATSNR